MLSVEKLSEWQVKEAEKVIHHIEKLDIKLIDIMNRQFKMISERNDKEMLKLKRCYLFCRLDDIFMGRVTELDGEDDYGYGHKDTD